MKGGDVPTTVGFVGPSGSGKTTLIERLIPVLCAQGLRIGVVKHHGHPIELDTEGKDTWRYRHAGARTTALVGADQVAVFDEGARELGLRDLLAAFYTGCELVLIEGFRAADQPSIVLARAPLPPDWRHPRRPIALASDDPDRFADVDPAWRGLPRYALDDVAGIAALVARRVTTRLHPR